MSTVKQAETPAEQPQAVHAGQVPQIDEDAIAAYLESHPDYFERHPAVLAQLALPHGAGSGAVSLIERQVSVLRQRNDSAESQLRGLVEVARGNDELADKIHTLSLSLIAAGSRREIVALLEQKLRMEFNADRSVMVLFGEESIDAAAMLHMIIMHPDCGLRSAVLRQRLLVCILCESLVGRGVALERQGDDVYVGGRKLTVSIAAPSGDACLIHLGVNVDPAGAPVEAIGLDELDIGVHELGDELMTRYAQELATAAYAETKVREVD